MQISIDINTNQATRMLSRLERRVGNLRPFFNDAGEILLRSVDKNFAAQGRPTRWKPSGRVKRDGGQTLSDTGRLRRSITREASATHAAVGTNVEYAAIHQFGGRIGPHVIRPKKAKALKIPGIGFVAKVNHPGSTIPARPFLLVQDEDWRKLRLAAIRHLQSAR